MTIWDERYKTGEGLRWWPNEELVRFLGKTYGDPRPAPCHAQMAIDLGCGTGCNMLALNQWGFFPYGYEASEQALSVARAYLSSWHLATALNRYELGSLVLPGHIPCTDNTADLVVDCQTIQHLSDEDHIKVYAEIARVLKPGGRFWSMHWAHGDAKVIYADTYPELHNIIERDLRGLYGDAGLKVASLEVYGRTYQARTRFADWFLIEAVKP